jgi:hypothetical protein
MLLSFEVLLIIDTSSTVHRSEQAFHINGEVLKFTERVFTKRGEGQMPGIHKHYKHQQEDCRDDSSARRIGIKILIYIFGAVLVMFPVILAYFDKT